MTGEMRPEQWRQFKSAARQEPGAGVPLALIVDSPWLPGYAGCGHLDYFLKPDLWFDVNLRFAREFPQVIPFPSWWVEYGMAIEPTACGCRAQFYNDHTPDVAPCLARIEDAGSLPSVNPSTDGLMPFALHLYRTQRRRILDAGYIIPAVAARGPLCLASFLRGVSPLMLDLAENPEAVHLLFEKTTTIVIDWLKAQAEAAGGTVEGIFVLDDIVGFLSAKAYQEFAHPYLKRICDAFPPEWIKVYHNDANIRPCLPYLADTGFQVLNWSHKVNFLEAREKTGGRMCLMGNVAPLDLGVRGTPAEVREAAREVLDQARGQGLILSVGGGVSPGMPVENVRAFVEALES